MSKESSSIYRLEHLDKFREYQKRYVEKKKQDENYLEKRKKYQKEYHKKYDKTYRDQNRKKFNEYTKKYREKLKINNKVLTELEEWLKINDKYSQGYFKQVLDYIDVLKEKYSLGGKENE